MRCDKWKDREFLNKQSEQCERSPRTYEQIGDAIDLFDVYSEISQLSMWAARPLIYEKNLKVKNIAIAEIVKEMAVRGDTSQNFSIKRAPVTEGRVQEILRDTRILIEGTDIQRENLAKEKVGKNKEVLYECPACHEFISVTLSKRDTVVSLRVTESDDSMYDYLAKRYGISRSLLLSGLLEAKAKYPNSFL